MGILGKADLPAGGTPTLLFTAGYNLTLNLRFTNRNTTNVNVRAAIGTGSSPAGADWIDYDIPVAKVLEDTGIAISTGEKVWAYSDTANVSVRAHGM